MTLGPRNPFDAALTKWPPEVEDRVHVRSQPTRRASARDTPGATLSTATPSAYPGKLTAEPPEPGINLVQAAHKGALGGLRFHASLCTPRPAPFVVLKDKMEGACFPWGCHAARNGQVACLHVVLDAGSVQ